MSLAGTIFAYMTGASSCAGSSPAVPTTPVFNTVPYGDVAEGYRHIAKSRVTSRQLSWADNTLW